MEDKNDLRRSGRNTRRVARRREDLSAKPRRVQTAVRLLSRLLIKFCDATTSATTNLARTSPANFPTPHVDSSFGPRKPPRESSLALKSALDLTDLAPFAQTRLAGRREPPTTAHVRSGVGPCLNL